MKFYRLPLCCLLIYFQIPASLCTLSEVWKKFMTFSCEFSSEVEKFVPKENRNGRSRRSIFDEDPDFDNPEELFAYLYPLADLKTDDLLQEAQRSSSTYQSNSIYTWAMDLGNLWITECRVRSGKESNDGDTAEEDVEDEELEGNRNRTHSPHRQIRSVYGNDEHPGLSNYKPGNTSSGQRPISSSVNPEASIPARSFYSQPSFFNGHQTKTQNINRTSGKTRRKRPYTEAQDRKLVTVNLSSSNVTTTTTEAPETTTTADPAASDDNFFSSYGGDIEYFFPLISFGIPFDGEITFLGFHGFKGLFPYK